jgi:bacteriorhodopsin
MDIQSIHSFFGWLEHTHPTIAAIFDCIMDLMAFGFFGHIVFVVFRRRFRAHQFSVYRKLLKRIQGKKASRKIAIRG